MTPDVIGHAINSLFMTALILTYTQGDKQRMERLFRPNRVRAKHREGILQAQALLRLIESTQYFDTIGTTVQGFIPEGAEGPYWDAFRRTFRTKANWLLIVSAFRVHAVKPGTPRTDW